MNPRAFCREPGYTAAIVLTYVFDPLFFERLVLPELWSGGTGDVLVVADRRRIDETSSRWAGQLRYLGQRYQLVKAQVLGSFHPKVILRLGMTGGALWVGSGNLTAGGWGGNRELAAAWRFGPELADDGNWVVRLLDQIESWCPERLQHDVLGRLRELPWIANAAGSHAEAPLIASFGARSLAEQLRERWSGRRFEEAWIVTGSTDRNGAMLDWLERTFGVKRSMVVVDPYGLSFEHDRLRHLPLSVEVMQSPVGKPIHAKLYWLRGTNGDAAVMGSANCSAAGWLASPDRGGNVEVVAVFDEASRELLGEAAQLFVEAALEPLALAEPREESEEISDPQPQVSITNVVWEPDLAELQVFLSTPVGRDAEVVLRLPSGDLDCRPGDPVGSWWVAATADPFEGRSVTLLSEVVIGLVDGTHRRELHWINDLGELRHASRGRQIAELLGALRGYRSPKEQQKILTDLQRISSTLLTDPSAFPDPPVRLSMLPTEEEAGREACAPALDPDELIRSLDEVAPLAELEEFSRIGSRLSLLGVMRAFFEFDGADYDLEEHQAASEPEGINEENTQTLSSVSASQASDPMRPLEVVPDNKLKQQLGEQIDSFLAQLRSNEFARNCSATQMVQAAAYPLAVAALGTRGGWVAREDTQRWAVTVFDVLFCEAFSPGERGLLVAVGARYSEHGRQESFHRIVGDGTLWLAFLIVLSALEWEGIEGAFKKSLTLRSVARHRDLLASADAGRLRGLFARQERKSARRVIDEVPRAVVLLGLLEEHLDRQWQALLVSQQESEVIHEQGDLLWRKEIGWAVAQEEMAAEKGNRLTVYLHYKAEITRVVAAGFYVNVTKASRIDTEIAYLLAQLEDRP